MFFSITGLLYDDVDMNRAELAISYPTHKSHIMEHLHEIKDLVTSMESKSARLLVDSMMSVEETEQLAEAIDESIHLLQYKIDHSRRLLQGSEINGQSPHMLPSPPYVLSDEKKVSQHFHSFVITTCSFPP